MKYSLVLVALLSLVSLVEARGTQATQITSLPNTQTNSTPKCSTQDQQMKNNVTPVSRDDVLTSRQPLLISVVGQGVSPTNTSSPAQAYALAKRAAVADAYRLIAERVKGVRIDGKDLIKNMMVQRSTVRTSVQAMIRNANIVETTFKDGLCEVEMEISLSRSQFPQ